MPLSRSGEEGWERTDPLALAMLRLGWGMPRIETAKVTQMQLEPKSKVETVADTVTSGIIQIKVVGV